MVLLTGVPRETPTTAHSHAESFTYEPVSRTHVQKTVIHTWAGRLAPSLFADLTKTPK